jgi:hypothetical protein
MKLSAVQSVRRAAVSRCRCARRGRWHKCAASDAAIGKAAIEALPAPDRAGARRQLPPLQGACTASTPAVADLRAGARGAGDALADRFDEVDTLPPLRQCLPGRKFACWPQARAARHLLASTAVRRRGPCHRRRRRIGWAVRGSAPAVLEQFWLTMRNAKEHAPQRHLPPCPAPKRTCSRLRLQLRLCLAPRPSRSRANGIRQTLRSGIAIWSSACRLKRLTRLSSAAARRGWL